MRIDNDEDDSDDNEEVKDAEFLDDEDNCDRV